MERTIEKTKGELKMERPVVRFVVKDEDGNVVDTFANVHCEAHRQAKMLCNDYAYRYHKQYHIERVFNGRVIDKEDYVTKDIFEWQKEIVERF